MYSKDRLIQLTVAFASVSVVTLLFGLARMKIAAVLVGPEGLGLVSLAQSTVGVLATLFGLGLSNVGARHIAAHQARDASLSRDWAGAAVLRFGLILSVACGVVAFLTAELWLRAIGLDPTGGWNRAFIAVAAAATIASGTRIAWLSGHGDMSAIFRIEVLGALLSLVAGSIALFLFGREATVAFVMLAPLSIAVIGWMFGRRATSACLAPTSSSLSSEYRALAALGGAFVVSGLFTNASQYLLKNDIQAVLGLADVGLFQAAWALSMYATGFLLSMQAREFYPRISRVHDNPQNLAMLINQQILLTCLVAGPLLAIAASSAPVIFELLFSSEFTGAAPLFRIQAAADFCRAALWPFVYLLLARGQSRRWVLVESLGYAVLLLVTYLAIRSVGLIGAGIAYALSFALLGAALLGLARTTIDFRFESPTVGAFSVGLGGVALAASLPSLLPQWAATASGAGVAGAVAFFIFTLYRRRQHVALSTV